MSKAVELLREHKSPVALELACTLGEWLFNSKEYEKAIECVEECVQEHLVDGNEIGAANDFYLIGCAKRELGRYEEAIEAFNQARPIYKKLKEVIHVGRCDQKIAYCMIALGDAENGALAAQRALDVFQTAHDHIRETFALFELGKAKVLTGDVDQGLQTLRKVLHTIAESDEKDFDFIIEVEQEIAKTLRNRGEIEAADEIERRILAVRDVIED
jgi:tetratricopeptide (TPR) repeat protein